MPVGKSEDRVELPQTHQFRLSVFVSTCLKKMSILEDFWLKTHFHLSLPLFEEDMGETEVASPTSNPQKLLTESSIYQQPQVFVKCTH